MVSAADAAVTPGGTGQPRGRDAGPGLGQQRVGVSVVAASKLHDDIVRPPRGRCAAPSSSLGARRDEAHLLRCRDPSPDQLGQLDLSRRGRPETRDRAWRPPARRPQPRGAHPSSAGPHEHTRSTYRRPSISTTWGPFADCRNTGVPPTEPNARTGEPHPAGDQFAGVRENLFHRHVAGHDVLSAVRRVRLSGAVGRRRTPTDSSRIGARVPEAPRGACLAPRGGRVVVTDVRRGPRRRR